MSESGTEPMLDHVYNHAVALEGWLRRALNERDQLREALKLVPLDEWENLAEEDLLDLIDQDVMLTFIAAASKALGEAA